ncbi:hypothetical protein D3C87_1412500 [compost metagenome]
MFIFPFGHLLHNLLLLLGILIIGQGTNINYKFVGILPEFGKVLFRKLQKEHFINIKFNLILMTL